METPIAVRVKIVYLLALSSGLFFVNHAAILAGLAAIQLVLYFTSSLSAGKLFSALNRLKLLAFIVILSYLLIPGETSQHSISLPVLDWFTLSLYPEGLITAGLMLTRIATLITASIWIRESEPPGSFIDALRWLRVPQSIAIAIDAGINLSTQKGGKRQSGTGQGNGGGNNRKKITITLAQLRSGKMGFFDNLINRSHTSADNFLKEHYPSLESRLRHDTAVILTVVAAAMSLKLLQLLPGLPIAPGHKNLVIVPLIVIASLTTHSRWGGFSAGLAIGVVSFMLGYGKFGVLEITHFALPGLVADITVPVILAGNQRLLLVRFALLGALIGLTRFAANFLIILLAGAPELAWVAFAPMLISQTVFGALSCLIGVYVVSRIKAGKLLTQSSATEDKTATHRGTEDV